MSDTTQKDTVPKGEKVIPLSEIEKHNSLEDLWMAVNGKVYDITKFVDQHPGGEEVLLEYAGGDATGPFDDVGHSENAIEILADYYVGEGNPEELKITAQKKTATAGSETSGGSSKGLIIMCILVAAAAYYYFKALKEF